MSAKLRFKAAKQADRLAAAKKLPVAQIPGHWLKDPKVDALVFERSLGSETTATGKASHTHPPVTTRATAPKGKK